ncbi:uncharacterized protein LOC130140595 [Syzygium oleosum]|uniref:uncharacterized protein LOC130140595 n=1 Tax=Syzygium oleosum TaxID=219896 RepID=UPI0024BB6A0F|nr:uncharacterized protein LOC130140595 [Syzygium oleosum]
MLTIVVTGLVLTRARRLSEVLSSSSDVWKEWELRGAVFMSLALQIVLIYLGDRRKYVPRAWIRVVTWSAYLLADSVAIYALGMISNMIGEIKADKLVSKMDPHAELSAFWAPFLLLHLGGPDTISAYAMEDNELWLRHSLTLVSQTGLTVYVLGMAWTHPSLSFLAILILLSGFYKYGERVWVLRAASNEHFKDSLAESQPRRKYSNKILEECELKGAEGYNVVPHQVIEVRDDAMITIDNAIANLPSQSLSSSKESKDQEYKDVGALLAARSLVDTSQRLFADHLFSLEERDTCLSILTGKPWEGFKVIEIELGLIYDMFYAKAKAVYTWWGIICRLAIAFSICVALVLFSFSNKRQYSKLDLCLTFLLLGAAIFLELYALYHILSSDRVACWLITNKQSVIFNIINWFRPLSKRRRWSNSMGQYSLMSCSFRKNDSCWWRFLKNLRIDEMVVKFLDQGREDVTSKIRELILEKFQEKQVRDAQKLPSVWIDRGGHVLSTQKLLDKLKWSIELDFDMSILVWHIATELCYFPHNGEDSIQELDRNNQSHVKYKSLMSLHLSRYMVYLLVMYPSMLPVGIGSIRFRDIYKEIKKYFAMPKSAPETPACDPNMQDNSEEDPEMRREHNPKIAEACNVLRGQVKTKFNLSVTKEDKVKYVLFNGCRLASELEQISPEETKWEVIRHVWVEMLIYAANKCKAKDHAQQMRRGGEFITHVWFLMAHFGLTNHFQIPHAPAVAEITVNSW